MQKIFFSERIVNKYDAAVRTFYLLFCAAAVVIFISVGLRYMTAAAWLLGFICSALGAAAYGTIAKLIIGMIRRDRVKSRSDILAQLFYVVFFSAATVAFITIGMRGGSVKTWILAFVGSYGAAFIYSCIARLIIDLARKTGGDSKASRSMSVKKGD